MDCGVRLLMEVVESMKVCLMYWKLCSNFVFQKCDFRKSKFGFRNLYFWTISCLQLKKISRKFLRWVYFCHFHCKRRFNVGVESNELGVGRNSLGHFSPTLLTALGLQPCGHNLPSPIR